MDSILNVNLNTQLLNFLMDSILNVNLNTQWTYTSFTSTGRLSPGLNLFHGKNLVRLE